ncbi:MAG: helix-turn-helix domain-containing protein [Pseudonocardiaceae bacterium]
MGTEGRAEFAELLSTLRAEADLSLGELGKAAHIARGYIHHLEHGRRWPSRTFVEALDRALQADGALLDTWAAANDDGPIPHDPDDRERLTLVVEHPRRVDGATVYALAGVLAATRRLEDVAGSAAVLPAVRHQLALARGFFADARLPVRNRIGALTGELHQYLGWLLTSTGNHEQGSVELDAALAIGVELDDPNLISQALSYKETLAWIRRDAHEVIALSRAAGRDERVSVTQHVFTAYQHARGWAMIGDIVEMDRALGRATELTGTAMTQQADAPNSVYWHGAAFFTMQRGLTSHMVPGSRYAARAAAELTSGVDQLPDTERYSEWAADFTISAAEAYADASEPERAVEAARRTLTVCRATRSTQLSASVRTVYARLREGWPTVAAVRELGDEVRTLSRPR